MTERKIVKLGSDTPEPDSEDRHDQIFSDPQALVGDFAFDEKTASVFDDMVGRSVPFYGEIQRMIGEIATDFAVPGTRLCDLGCATGTSLLSVDETVPDDVLLVGIDNSADMLAKAERKLAAAGMKHRYQLINGDLETLREFENVSVALMVLTLQFVRPLRRQRLVADIFDGLNPNGALVLVEKLSLSSTLLNRMFIQYYYDMKRRNGYSDTEIFQKREALENVLIPYRFEENVELLRDTGFRFVEEFFRWHNFCGIVAVK